MKLSQLRQLILVETRRALREQLGQDEAEKGEDSLDAQVDKYLIDYEKESKASKTEGKDFRSFVRRFLTEAEDDEKKDDEDKGDDEEKGAEEKKETKKLSSDDIDVDVFVDSVMRLVDNYDNLLEVRDTVLRRAVNFLLKSYEKDVVDAFKEDLIERYDVEIGKSKFETDDDKFQAPPADRAGVNPGGG
jgi:hypothetical protein